MSGEKTKIEESLDDVHLEDEVELNYKPPPEKSISELVNADAEDESLRKYKEALLGDAKGAVVEVDPSNPKKVIVQQLALLVEGRPDVVLDLSGDLTQLKKQVFTIKEGVPYKLRIDFYVQREIVHGLKYVQQINRMGLKAKMTQMMGSYPPKMELQSYTTPPQDTPEGMLARGTYSVSSLFTDDDKHEHLKWEWAFEIKKDWKD